MGSTRDSWLDNAGEFTTKTLKIKRTPDLPTPPAGGTGTKTIKIRRAPEPTIREGDTISVDGTTIRIVGRQPKRESSTTEFLERVVRARDELRGQEQVRNPPRKAKTPVAEPKFIDMLRDAVTLYDVKKACEQFFWLLWSYATYGFAIMFLLRGLFSMNPLFAALALMFGLLGWKGKQIATWFDAKEAAIKAKREAKYRQEVEAEAQRRTSEGKAPEPA